MSTITQADPSSALAGTEFSSILLQLVGEPILFMRRSYGDELVLHFGERVVGVPRKTKHGEFRYEHGTCSLHLRGSAWVIKSGQVPTVISSGLVDEISKALGEPLRAANVETEVTITPGARVTSVVPFPVERPLVKGIGLRVDFSDGSSVVVVPTPDEPREAVLEGTPLYEIGEHRIIDWQLRTPHGTLEAGPGMKWSWHYSVPPHTAPPHTDTEVAT